MLEYLSGEWQSRIIKSLRFGDRPRASLKALLRWMIRPEGSAIPTRSGEASGTGGGAHAPVARPAPPGNLLAEQPVQFRELFFGKLYVLVMSTMAVPAEITSPWASSTG